MTDFRRFKSKQIFFPSGNLKLEGILTFPQDVSLSPGVILCHPHPAYGGDMNNNVVLGVTEALKDAGFAILRFNFRGVHLSEGDYDEGEGEIADVISAASFLKAEAMVDTKRLFLAGYSFGAWVGLRAAGNENDFKAVAGISPPLGVYDFDFLKNNIHPILLMSGDRDSVCDASELENTFDIISSPKKKSVLPGVDHFYGGREKEAGDLVKKFFCCYL